MRSPSVSNWRTTRPRLAPSASRTPISRWRAVALASMTLDAFAQAATSTSAKAVKTGDRIASSSTLSRTGVACTRSSARAVSSRPFSRDSNGSSANALWAWVAVIPALRRTITPTARGWVPPKISCLVTGPAIVTGTQRSSGESSRPWNAGRVTPTTTNFCALSSMSLPMTAGSRSNMRVQVWSLNTATGASPIAAASYGASPRPSCMGGPSASK